MILKLLVPPEYNTNTYQPAYYRLNMSIYLSHSYVWFIYLFIYFCNNYKFQVNFLGEKLIKLKLKYMYFIGTNT